MKKQKLHFKINNEIEFPQEIIDDSPRQGAFDGYAEWLVENFDVKVSLKDSINYLKECGAWDNEELQDIEKNKKRLLWIAILDCKENKTNYWYMGI